MEQKNLLEVLDFSLDLFAVGKEMAADKKLDLKDLGTLIARAPQLIGEGVLAIQDITLIPTELAAMKDEDAVACVAHVMTKLAVENEKAKLIVEESLKTVVQVYKLGKAIAA